MVKLIDTRERETQILNLVVESYINESKPISSSYLCEKHNLPYSPATVRNIMLSLENKGLLSHIHTSSGRIPTKEGFKYYVERFMDNDWVDNYPAAEDYYSRELVGMEQVVNYTLNVLAETSGYASLGAVFGKNEKLFFSGTRFILDQPEFGDIARLKSLFYVLEVKMARLQEILFNCLDERTKIFIGDELGFDEIPECALVVSGMKDEPLSCSLALLGPMRMDYAKAVSCLHTVRDQFREVAGYLL